MRPEKLRQTNNLRALLGRFAHPQNEVARFRVHPSLAFPASQIQAMHCPENDSVDMVVNFMGLNQVHGAIQTAVVCQITVMKKKAAAFAVRVLDQMVDSSRVE